MSNPELTAGRLPTVAEYDLPSDVPPCRVTWKADPGRVALLIHDMQRYFLRVFPKGSSLVRRVSGNIRALRDRCDALGIPVFYTAQTPHRDSRDRGLQADLWGPGLGADPSDSDIIPPLVPGEGHEVLRKWRYSAFQRSALHPMMIARGRDQLIVTGIYAHIGCLLTAADAFMRDVQPFFPADAVADFSLQRHRSAVEYVGQNCGRTLLTSELLNSL